MALKKKFEQKANNFVAQPDMEAGTYPARLVQIIDLGLQPQKAWQGEDKKPADEVLLTYEFVDCFMVDEEGNDIEDKPRWNSETIRWYGHKAQRGAGVARYNAFDPDDVYDGDLAQCIETPVLVTITINKKGEKVYTNIDNVAAMRARDAAKCPELVNPPKVFNLDEPDMEVFNKLPKWLQDKIKGNLNYAGSALEKALVDQPEKNDEPKEEKAAKPKNKVPKKADPVDDEADEGEDAPW